jgi:hypothetical protein
MCGVGGCMLLLMAMKAQLIKEGQNVRAWGD